MCQACEAYVGVHDGTDIALGRLANKELRMTESFHISITYKNKERQFGIIPRPDHSTKSIHHEVWEDCVYFFTLIPTGNHSTGFGWRDKDTLSAVDDLLICAIGEAIEDHD